jgi:hypothetical protein
MRVAFSSIAWNTGCKSPGDELITLRTSAVAVSRSSASSRSRRSCANSPSAPAVEELLRCDAGAEPRFGIALRRCALALLLIALERRRMAYPKAQDYAVFKVALQQRFATGEMGFNDKSCCKKS